MEKTNAFEEQTGLPLSQVKQGVCAVTAVVPAFRRVEPLLKTLRRIQFCKPGPAEILVHVDGGTPAVVERLKREHPEVQVLSSDVLLGPGGSRNQLIARAANELVANFDDDSFPAHEDYFARVMSLGARFPDAAMFSAASQKSEWGSLRFKRIAVFSGCGCVFRKSWFERVQGFVPLPVAYNMEEVDVSLQLHSINGRIVHDPMLRVVHDHPLLARIDSRTNAQILANTALFPFLRFPVWLWPLGAGSVLGRLVFLLRQGWTAGLLEGLRMIPLHLLRHASFRRSMSVGCVLTWLKLKRCPEDLGAAVPLS